MARDKQMQPAANGGAALRFEATLWATADKLRGNLDAAEYKHVVLGLIFLKYISDAFEERHAQLAAEKGADPEDREEYLADNIFWVPASARWAYLQGRAKLPSIGNLPWGSLGWEPPDCRLRLLAAQALSLTPLGTTDLSCGRLVKDLTCRRYAADEKTSVAIAEWQWDLQPGKWK